MEVLKTVNERLRRQGYGIRLSLSQIEEQIEQLSDEDWNELLGWMENQLEDVPSDVDVDDENEDEEENFDPEPQPRRHEGGGWY